jgi:hypothetical protein
MDPPLSNGLVMNALRPHAKDGEVYGISEGTEATPYV